jgi:hypothetical protein
MTPLDLEAIRARLRAATPGKWELREDGDYYQCGTYVGVGPYYYNHGVEIDGRHPVEDEGTYFRTDVCRIENAADEQFLLNAPADIAALLAECDRLRVETRWMGAPMCPHCDHYHQDHKDDLTDGDGSSHFDCEACGEPFAWTKWAAPRYVSDKIWVPE